MVIVLYGLVLGYVVLQARLLYQLGSGWRVAAAVPLIITVPALVLSIWGLIQQSNRLCWRTHTLLDLMLPGMRY